ncbi:MAG: cytidine deaminase [Rhodothermales bacterium]
MHDDAALSLLTPYVARSPAPYSRQPHAVLAVLSDGAFVPGVRVESASFGLTIGAVLNAITTSYALDRTDVVGIVSSQPLMDHDVLYVRHAVPDGHVLESRTPALLTAHAGALPEHLHELSPFIPLSGNSEEDLVHAARKISARAWIPESRFPVGCVVPSPDEGVVPGVNVEHPDWGRILCAERNVLGTLVSYGRPVPAILALSCPKEEDATPCGACRQVLAELAPEASVWMDRGNRPAERVTAASLLPNFFTGSSLACS